MSEHFIKRCTICGTVTSQCRCISKDKRIIPVVCGKCASTAQQNGEAEKTSTNKAMPKLPTLEEVFAGLNYDGRNAAELNIGVGAGIRRCYDFIAGKIGNS